MDIKKLPKIELHCHLDGSVRPETVLDIANKEGITLPTYDIEEIRNNMIAPMDCECLDEYLQRFDLPNKVMQSKESLSRVAYELLEDSAKDNIRYIEIRFGPLLHTLKGLTLEEVIDSVLLGMKKGEEDFNIKSNLILSCLRIHEVDTVYDVINAGRSFLNKGVVAMDLAASEVAGFAHKYVEHMAYARELGYKVTIHAGETGVGANVYDAITLLGAERIGHGVYISNHKEAYDLVKQNNIVLEMCPTSNVQTKAVTSYEKHPIMTFLKDDIRVTLNTDNTTVSDTTLGREVELTNNLNGMSLEDYKIIYANSVQGAFLSETEKEELMKAL